MADEKKGRFRVWVEVIGGLVTIAGFVFGVVQWVIPQAHQAGVADGKKEIAAAVLEQLAAGGYVTTEAKTLLNQGSPDKAVSSALKAMGMPKQDDGDELVTGRSYRLTPFEIPVALKTTMTDGADMVIGGNETLAQVGAPLKFPAPADKCELLLVRTSNTKLFTKEFDGTARVQVRCQN